MARYVLDDVAVVVFEIEPPPGYRPAGAADLVSQVYAAAPEGNFEVTPAWRGASARP